MGSEYEKGESGQENPSLYTKTEKHGTCVMTFYLPDWLRQGSHGRKWLMGGPWSRTEDSRPSEL